MSEQEEVPEATEEEKPDLSAEEGPTVAEKAEAELDAALAAMDPHDDDDEEDRAPAPKAKKKAEEDDEEPEEEEPELDDDEDEPEDSDAESEEESEEDDEDEDMALHRAYMTLHDGPLKVPTSVLKRTPKEQLIACANSVEARAEKNGAKTPEPASERDTGNGAKAETEEPAQANVPDWATVRKGIADKLGIDEDSADAFKYLHDALVASQTRADALMSKLEDMHQSVQARDGRETIDSNLRRLQARYPQLKRDQDAAREVVDEAQTIVAGLKARNKPIDVKKVFNQAALARLGQPKRSDLSQLRRNGISQPPNRVKGLSTEHMSEDEMFAKSLDHIDAGQPHLAKRVAERWRPPPPKRKR